MLQERFLGCDGELICRAACRIELEQQDGELEVHRVRGGFRVLDIVAAEERFQPRCPGRDAPDPARGRRASWSCAIVSFAARPGVGAAAGPIRGRPDEPVLLAEEGTGVTGC